MLIVVLIDLRFVIVDKLFYFLGFEFVGLCNDGGDVFLFYRVFYEVVIFVGNYGVSLGKLVRWGA